jgi:phosphohistidine swiveling domain-containing protein
MDTLLAHQFLKEVAGQELWPVMHNSAPLINAAGWTKKKYLSQSYRNGLSFPAFVSIKDGEGVMYIPLTKAKQLAEETFLAYLENPKVLQDRESSWQVWRGEIDSLYEKMDEAYCQSVTGNILRADLERLREAIWNYNASAFFSTGFYRDVCEKALAGESGDLDDELWIRILQPPTASFKKRHGWKLAELIGSGLQSTALYERCQYFFASYDGIPETEMVPSLLDQQYAAYIGGDGISKAVAEQRQFGVESEAHAEWTESLPSRQKDIAYFFQRIVAARDERKDYLLKTSVIAFRVASALLGKSDIPKSLSKYLMFEEIMSGPEYIVQHRAEIEARPLGFDVFCPYDGEPVWQYGKTSENRKLIGSFYRVQNDTRESVSELKGNIGSKGVAVGRVKIVRNVVSESVKFQDGDILVTGMTRPEFVPLMQRASAIITDEGGITCHAAIIARELDKPCIIGTKIATQVLHDGDLVEVDADNGVVRVLERS